jgi:hypothetical protein
LAILGKKQEVAEKEKQAISSLLCHFAIFVTKNTGENLQNERKISLPDSN